MNQRLLNTSASARLKALPDGKVKAFVIGIGVAVIHPQVELFLFQDRKPEPTAEAVLDGTGIDIPRLIIHIAETAEYAGTDPPENGCAVFCNHRVHGIVAVAPLVKAPQVTGPSQRRHRAERCLPEGRVVIKLTGNDMISEHAFKQACLGRPFVEGIIGGKAFVVRGELGLQENALRGPEGGITRIVAGAEPKPQHIVIGFPVKKRRIHQTAFAITHLEDILKVLQHTEKRVPGKFPLDVRADTEILEGIFFFGLIPAILADAPELIGKIAVCGIEIQDVTLLRKINGGVNRLNVLLAFGKNPDYLHRRNTREAIPPFCRFKRQRAREAISPAGFRCPEQSRDHQVVHLTCGIRPQLRGE